MMLNITLRTSAWFYFRKLSWYQIQTLLSQNRMRWQLKRWWVLLIYFQALMLVQLPPPRLLKQRNFWLANFTEVILSNIDSLCSFLSHTNASLILLAKNLYNHGVQKWRHMYVQAKVVLIPSGTTNCESLNYMKF